MKKKTILISIVLLLVLVVIVGYNYVFQGHRNIAKEQSEFVLAANLLIEEFANEPELSQTKYLNKTIEISGAVTNMDSNTLTVSEKVFCQFISTIDPAANLNEQITVKGRFIGYDDLLEEIKLDQCIVVKK